MDSVVTGYFEATLPASDRQSGLDDLEFVLAGLHGMAAGVAMLDEQSRLIYCNDSAQSTTLAAGWSICGGMLIGPSDAVRNEWMQALRDVCQRGLRRLIEFRSGTGSSFASIVPVAIKGAIRAWVTFGRMELCGALELQMFAGRHQLTSAESRVLRQLSLGLRPAEIADAHGVQVTTVLTQVSAIRAKTRSSSVQQLLATLALLPPVRRLVAGIEPDRAASRSTAEAAHAERRPLQAEPDRLLEVAA